MYLRRINIEDFKSNIYSQYEKLFPELERKSFNRIKDTYDRKMVDIFEINESKNNVGFILANHIVNNPYVQLDYFAIYEKYQNKGYGTKALGLLKEEYKDYDGIFIEIEKIGLGKNKQENIIREKRERFYKNIGFKKLDFDLELFSVIYSAHMLPCKEKSFNDERVKKNIFDFYIAILGETKANKNCKII